jgi:hypothetical protein
MNEPEFLTPEWHQHILDRFHDETGVRIHHDQMEFPGGHTFPVIQPWLHLNRSTKNIIAQAYVASEHLYPKKLSATTYLNKNKQQYVLNFYSPNNPNTDNDVRYSTLTNYPTLLHPEQFGLEVQKRLRTVQDPEISEYRKKRLIEGNKERIQRHLSRNKKILFSGRDKNDNNQSTLYDPHTNEVQSVHPDDWGNY